LSAWAAAELEGNVMQEELRRLVYYSVNAIEGSPDDIDHMLRDILETSRRNNPKLNITGALMFNANCFVQVLEGPRAAVEQLLQRFHLDKRHKSLAVLAFSPIAERAFGEWSMAFVGARAADGRLKAFAAESGFDPTRMSGEATLDFLHKMVLAQDQELRQSC